MAAVLSEALQFAAAAHERMKQKRKGSDLPYIVHPVEVMTILRRHGERDEPTLAAALLHDVVEDCRVPIDEIRARFGERVASIVEAVTKPHDLPKPEQKRVARELLLAGPPAARVVKMADRLSNLLDLDELAWTDEKKAEYRAEALDIAAIGEAAHPGLAAALRAQARSGARG
jgi:guanosine-3',5'-bis(diphosphate) 3'-pyrophosphohydrolase